MFVSNLKHRSYSTRYPACTSANRLRSKLAGTHSVFRASSLPESEKTYPEPIQRLFTARQRLREHFQEILGSNMPTHDPSLIRALNVAARDSFTVMIYARFLRNVLGSFPLWENYSNGDISPEALPRDYFVARMEAVVREVCDRRTVSSLIKSGHPGINEWTADHSVAEVIGYLSDSQLLQAVVRLDKPAKNTLGILHIHRILAYLDHTQHSREVLRLGEIKIGDFLDFPYSGPDAEFIIDTRRLDKVQKRFAPDKVTGRPKIWCMVATHNGKSDGNVVYVMTTRDAISFFLHRMEVLESEGLDSASPTSGASDTATITHENQSIIKEKLVALYEQLNRYLSRVLGPAYSGDLDHALTQAYTLEPYNKAIDKYRKTLLLGSAVRCVHQHETSNSGELPYAINPDFLIEYRDAVRAVCKSPKVGDVFCAETLRKTGRPQITLRTENSRLTDVVREMRTGKYLQVIVHCPEDPKHKLQALLAIDLLAWIHSRTQRKEAIELEHTTVGDVLEFVRQTRDHSEHIQFIRPDVTMDDARRLFLPKSGDFHAYTWMLIITDNGQSDGNFIGLITSWDAVKPLYHQFISPAIPNTET